MIDLDVTISVDGKDLSVKELLDIDQADLSNEFASQAARYAYFAVLTAEAEKLWLAARRVTKEEEAAAFSDYKKVLPVGSKRVTDKEAESRVVLDEECASLRDAELEAQRKYGVLKAITNAFWQRANMLQSMGAQLRHEMDMTNMSVRPSAGDKLRGRLMKK